jgi:hypothetical protein
MKHLPGRGAVLLLAVMGLATLGLSQAPNPGVQILSPENDAVVQGPDVVVKMRVQGVQLTPRRSGNGAYLMLRMDDSPPVKGYSDTFTYRDVPAGNHVVRVELRRADGTVFNPPLRTQVRFSVRAEQP